MALIRCLLSMVGNRVVGRDLERTRSGKPPVKLQNELQTWNQDVGSTIESRGD